ncbi:MAG: hypothetical protein ACRD0X_06045 [Thermoanaerobaculia bacterium]
MTSTTFKHLGLALVAGLAAAPAWAQGVGYRAYTAPNELRFRLGLFEPSGESAYWQDKQIDFTGEPEDFEDLIVGGEYLRRLGGRASLVAGASAYSTESSQFYRAFVDENGLDIVHDTLLEIASLTLGVRASLTGSEAPLQPWVGAGGGLYFWNLEESGDFIAFTDPEPFIFSATFVDDGAAFGWYYGAGLDVPLGSAVVLFAEARWHEAEDELSGDFEGLGDLDLSGREFAGGISWRF